MRIAERPRRERADRKVDIDRLRKGDAMYCDKPRSAGTGRDLVMRIVTFALTCAAAIGVAEGAGAQLNDETVQAESIQPEIASVAIDPASVVEGERSRVAIVATLDREAESRLRVPVVVDGAEGEYRVSGRRFMVFGEGSRSATTRVTVWASDDNVHERTELIEVSVGSGDAGVTNDIEVVDDDGRPTEAELTVGATGDSLKLTATLKGETTFDWETDVIVLWGGVALGERIRIDAQKRVGSIVVKSERLVELLARQIDGIASEEGNALPLGFRGEAVGEKLLVNTGVETWGSIIKDAVARWGATQRANAESSGVADLDLDRLYGDYLRKSYRVIRSIAADDSELLTATQLAEYLELGAVNRRQALVRDRGTFSAATRENTAEGLEAYLQAFPKGQYTNDARELRDALNLSCVQPYVKFRDCRECPEMAVVPAGSYTMGGDVNDEWSESVEHPAHRVTVVRPFAVGAKEVTESEYARVLPGDRAGCWQPDGSGGEGDTWRQGSWPRMEDETRDGNEAAVCVNWEDARRFAEALGNDLGYRLLTEAEWEYVARAGSVGRRFSFGPRLTEEMANYRSPNETPVGVTPVGTYDANEWGLYDLHGNLWEWVQDVWKEDYKGAPSDGSAYEGEGELRVMRGGSWADEEHYLRSAMRGRGYPEIRTNFTGFRVAREVDRCPLGGTLRLVSEKEMMEDGAEFTIVVSAEVDVPPIADMIVTLSLSGTASDTDYATTEMSPTIVVPAGEKTGRTTVTVVPVDDDVYEGKEIIEIRGDTDGLRLGGTEVILKDDDDGVTVTVDRQEIEEGSGEVKVNVVATVSKELADVLNMKLEFGGTAAMGVDYVVTPEEPVIQISKEHGEGSVRLTLEGLLDDVSEGAAETIVVRGRTVAGSESRNVIGAQIGLKDGQ